MGKVLNAKIFEVCAKTGEGIDDWCKWLENEVKGKRWDTYFSSYEYYNLTIYGAGDLGKMLIWALSESEIKVNCVIDRRARELKQFEFYDVFRLDEFLGNNIDCFLSFWRMNGNKITT